MFLFLKKTALYILAIPVLFIGMGIASNQLVLAANHGRFPVQWNAYKVAEYDRDLQKVSGKTDKKGKPTDEALQAQFDLYALEEHDFIDNTHVLMTSDTHLNFLADYLDFHTAIYSPGDEMLELGYWLLEFAFPVWCFAVIQKLRKQDTQNGYIYRDTQ